MDPITVGLWVELAGKLVKVGVGSYDAIKSALASDPNFEADNARLDEISAEYDRRIALAKQESGS